MREATCKHCGVVFVAQRSTAKFCGPTCRKSDSRSQNEPSIKGSPSKRRENLELFGYHYDLSATYYALQPSDRPVWLRSLIERDKEKIKAQHDKLFNRCLKKLPKLQLGYSQDHARLAYCLALIPGGRGPIITDEHRARWGLA